MTRSAILGSTGFVGTTLSRQVEVTERYHSRNIEELRGYYDRVICAAAPGTKWAANQNPAEDWAAIESLASALRRVEAKEFVLISTVDVFASPVKVDETTSTQCDSLSPYGRHRLWLEQEVRGLFERNLVVRLSGLVGRGLRKNIIFDLLNNNNLDSVDYRSTFQFYPMDNLWKDISTALAHGLSLVHLTAEPTSVGEISRVCFGRAFRNTLGLTPASYDFRSVHASLYGAEGHYQYSAEDVFQAVKKYQETEPLTEKEVS